MKRVSWTENINLLTLNFIYLMQTVFLYLDPGTGSMLLQAMIAGTLGFAMFLKNIKLALWSFVAARNFSNFWLFKKLKHQYASCYAKYDSFKNFVHLMKRAKFKLESLF